MKKVLVLAVAMLAASGLLARPAVVITVVIMVVAMVVSMVASRPVWSEVRLSAGFSMMPCVRRRSS